jgi:DNA-binding response OmpR family regulator
MAKILVIDDEPEIRELFAEVLVSAGHEVISASDGRMGFELFMRHRPVLVITDLLIPGIPGLELIGRLRQEASVKIIAISGSSVGNLDAARQLGAAVTLRKPLSVDRLIATVGQLLGESPTP